ncbi:MAG: hypothetical protein KY475_08025 [Planctomycetes bacterium]|nr:hypothetical protein [Planctomycetota bacterium]
MSATLHYGAAERLQHFESRHGKRPEYDAKLGYLVYASGALRDIDSNGLLSEPHADPYWQLDMQARYQELRAARCSREAAAVAARDYDCIARRRIDVCDDEGIDALASRLRSQASAARVQAARLRRQQHTLKD